MLRVSSKIIAGGVGSLALGGVAYLISTYLLAGPPELPSWVNRVKFDFVFSYWVWVLVGLTLIIFGLILRRRGE